MLTFSYVQVRTLFAHRIVLLPIVVASIVEKSGDENSFDSFVGTQKFTLQTNWLHSKFCYLQLFFTFSFLSISLKSTVFFAEAIWKFNETVTLFVLGTVITFSKSFDWTIVGVCLCFFRYRIKAKPEIVLAFTKTQNTFERIKEYNTR